MTESAPKQQSQIQPSGNNTPRVPHALRTYFIWMFLKPTQANAFVLPVSLLSFLPQGLKPPKSYSALVSLLNLSFPESSCDPMKSILFSSTFQAISSRCRCHQTSGRFGPATIPQQGLLSVPTAWLSRASRPGFFLYNPSLSLHALG